MARRRRTTPKQRAASRRNLAKARKARGRRRIKRAAVVTGVAMGAATGAYAVDRKLNTMKVYHNTSHHRARQIAKKGYAPGKEGRRPNLAAHHGTGKAGSHEEGRVFFAAGKNNAKFFGPAATSKRVRKKAFYRVAHLDNHPAAIAHGFDNFYYIHHSALASAGLARGNYGRVARARANVNIRRRGQGMT